jgi:hypothetical protein
LIWNHAPLVSHFPQRAFRTTGVRTTLCTTSFQHNEPSYHACTTGIRTTEIAQRAARKPDSPHPKRKGNDNCAATGAERFAVQPPRARHTNCQNANDLVRAAVGWNGVFGISVNHFGLSTACTDHTILVSRHPQRALIGTTPIWNHARHNERRSGTTRIWDHAAEGRRSAQRAFILHLAPRALRTTGMRTTPA